MSMIAITALQSWQRNVGLGRSSGDGKADFEQPLHAHEHAFGIAVQEFVITRASEAFGPRVLQHRGDAVFAAQPSGFDGCATAIFVAEGGVVADDVAVVDDAAIQRATEQ